MEHIMLMDWDRTVARAVPAAPNPRYFTKMISPAMLSTQDIATKYMGLRESPYPRSMALMAL